ncbi:DnaJ-domain-containing protein [Jaminaea rosea]|uniref:DnaJ-domain-containing protein n=1 Tax=Jaminaea rosea TaxID=1569628 RepID=A0A316UKN8_9BASI|nr:DnaJ-domain-containing protein [Jaminaea rosea]PWN25836.1 DnaJ-domain-containing protein [Jaminaea rosea]
MTEPAPSTATAPAADKPRDQGRDGKVADMEYYDLLSVPASASDLELKKAYRKAAIVNHPDKGGDEEKFKLVGEAYRVLSDSNLRADYDRHGKKKPTDEVGLKEATEMFGNLFGGERFVDYIGEISLLKDFGKASEIMMSEEEKAEMEAKLKEEQGKSGEAATGATEPGASATPAAAAATAAASTPAGKGEATTATTNATATSETASASGSTPSSAGDTHLQAHDPKSSKRPSSSSTPSTKLTPEQKAKLEELETQKSAAEQQRIKDLTAKLLERIRPFVTSRNPGDANDSETQLFEKKMRQEAEDLKLESFGVELLHVIGSVYLSKSTTWIKSQRHHFLGLPGFFSRLKEKGGMVKETWNLLGSAVSVQMSMEDLAKRQEKGEIPEDELRQLEQEMSGKMLLATWRGTRWEVTGVLRRVCDAVLNEKGVDQKTLLHRARALALLGTIYKQVKPDESDEERRELERLVAEAAGKSKHGKDKHKKDKSAGEKAGESGTSTPAGGKAAGATPAAAA